MTQTTKRDNSKVVLAGLRIAEVISPMLLFASKREVKIVDDALAFLLLKAAGENPDYD